tara:strand:- start:42146 stop:43285 length:1140 start_codon:yes stop_codon:yes gene_type:complete
MINVLEDKKVNLLYITSTNWSQNYFDFAIKKYLKKYKIRTNKLHLVCINKDSKKIKYDQNLYTYNNFFLKINGNISQIFNKSTILKFKNTIDHLNSLEWTIITDNEIRNHELLFYASLNLNHDMPLIVLDHGLKNSQDSKFYEYFFIGRFIRNIFLIYAFLVLKNNFKKLLNIKFKRIYFHYRNPYLRINNFFKMGLIDLEREIESYRCKKEINSIDKSMKRKILILTSGAHRYKYSDFKNQSLLVYKKILCNPDFSDYDFIIKIKPREDIDFLKKELFKVRKNIEFFDSSFSIGYILKVKNIEKAITLYQSITLASLTLMKIKTFGYFIEVPFKLRKSSYFYNFYKPKKIYKLISISGFDFITLDYDRLQYYFKNNGY